MAANNILLVEGKNDQAVIWSLLEHYKVAETFKVEYREGYTNILNYRLLRNELRASERDRLGIILDADEDVVARWQSLTDILTRIGYMAIPNQPDPNGTIVEKRGLPQVGVWLMPDNLSKGMLEDFVAFLVPDPANNGLWQLSEKCLQEAIAISGDIPRAKGRIHTWLAWQPNPGTPLGQAITNKYLDANAPYALQLVNWLNRVFN